MATESTHDIAGETVREKICQSTLSGERGCLTELLELGDPGPGVRKKSCNAAADLVRELRDTSEPGLMEVFLAEYGLSTDEGIALMCLAEALLRVPDPETIDALIEDKIAPSDWGRHLGHSSSPLVNASTWALLLTGKVLEDSDGLLLGTLRGIVKRLGEPVIRTAVGRAMREMGRQFVLGRDIDEARREAAVLEGKGFTYSYDMLGEAARTERDAKRYHIAYSTAIGALGSACTSGDIRENPGISVKLSALHPRYEFQKYERVMQELVPRTRSLALLAKSAGMGFNIDAEEADRLDLSLDVIEEVLSDPSLKGWDGFGVVVQAYGQRAYHVIDWLYHLADKLDRKIMVRLVKGAYWDTEIKLAQTLGLKGFPVFTRKASTDVSYLACARKLLIMTDRIYPQFATHNAHTVCSVLELAGKSRDFEFQRLHGMGEALHQKVMQQHGTRCRIYAPVGAHRDLLAYLVRRLLENGANSSFVNQIVDKAVTANEIAADPFEQAREYLDQPENPNILQPPNLYGKSRRNSRGWNLADPVDVSGIEAARTPYRAHRWQAGPMLAEGLNPKHGEERPVFNPADPTDQVGQVLEAGEKDTVAAISAARDWSGAPPGKRADVLRQAADLYEENFGELFALLSREAGKTLLDCVGELREAVDFLRYYADEAVRHGERRARGIVGCISPWNFPLAIFTGQISAALAAGNGVIAKPAEATSLIAHRAVQLMHQAGVPAASLQLLPGAGSVVGETLSSSPALAGMCFTGSTGTAQLINRRMAEFMAPDAPLIAETGGLNAMIVDSTALPEQAVRDIVASAFQSAGQRCSALRVLYVQEDIRDAVEEMLCGAMDELLPGDPWMLNVDVGPVIDRAAKKRIDAHVENARSQGRLLKELPTPASGTFVGPALLKVDSIRDLEEEIFGPVLHLATFKADELGDVIRDINETGYGLTFGLHTRIDDRVQYLVDWVRAGNIYVNRNQIGAIVGSQPFGGEGMSGTGPKAGGPHYVNRFYRPDPETGQQADAEPASGTAVEAAALQASIDAARFAFRPIPRASQDMPGPTGESNRLSVWPRGVVLCMGPTPESFLAQAETARRNGCEPVVPLQPGDNAAYMQIDPDLLGKVNGYDGVCYSGPQSTMRMIRQQLSDRDGPLIPLITDLSDPTWFGLERHVCVDTTASGGNAALLAAQSA